VKIPLLLQLVNKMLFPGKIQTYLSFRKAVLR